MESMMVNRLCVELRKQFESTKKGERKFLLSHLFHDISSDAFSSLLLFFFFSFFLYLTFPNKQNVLYFFPFAPLALASSFVYLLFAWIFPLLFHSAHLLRIFNLVLVYGGILCAWVFFGGFIPIPCAFL